MKSGKVSFVGLVTLITLSFSPSAFAQVSGEGCSKESIEAPINVSQIISFVPASKRVEARREFDLWNSQNAALMERTSTRLFSYRAQGKFPPSYYEYKYGAADKLRLFERYGVAHCLSIADSPSTATKRVQKASQKFAEYERSEPGVRDGEGKLCADQSPAGRCWCKLGKTIESGVTPALAITQCAKLAGAEFITAQVGRSECVFSSGDERGTPLTPSTGCSCADVSPLYDDVEEGGRIVCRTSTIGEARREGIYQLACREEQSWNPSTKAFFTEPICIDSTDGTQVCDSASRLHGTTPSLSTELPSRTKEYLGTSVASIDHKLRASHFGCTSSSYFKFTGGGSRGDSKDRDTGSGFVEPPPTTIDGKGDQDQWAVPSEQNASLLLLLQDFVKRVQYINPETETLVDPKATHQYEVMSNAYGPVWFEGWQRSAKLAHHGSRAAVAEERVALAMGQLEHLRKMKKLALLTMQEMALNSRLYEEKKYSALKAKTITSVGFTALSYVLTTTGIGGVGSVAVSAIGHVAGAAVEVSVGPDEASELSRAQIAMVDIKGYMKYGAKEVVKAVALPPAYRMAMSSLVSQRVAASVRSPVLAAAAAEVAQNARYLTFTKNVVGKGIGASVSVVSTYIDHDGYVTRDVQSTNPWEVALAQAERGLQDLNKHISALKAELSAAVQLRDKELNKARAIYCLKPDGTPLDDPEQCN